MKRAPHAHQHALGPSSSEFIPSLYQALSILLKLSKIKFRTKLIISCMTLATQDKYDIIIPIISDRKVNFELKDQHRRPAKRRQIYIV